MLYHSHLSKELKEKSLILDTISYKSDSDFTHSSVFHKFSTALQQSQETYEKIGIEIKEHRPQLCE